MHSNVVTRLENRRQNVLMTLEHIRAQQAEVDTNTEWKDLHAQRRRSDLLADLLKWYNGRLNRIDHALSCVGPERERSRTARSPRDVQLRG